MAVSAAEPVSSVLSYDEFGRRFYTSVYKVKSDIVSENPRTVANAVGIPARGSVYSWPPAAYGTPVVDNWSFAGPADVAYMDPKDRTYYTVTVRFAPAGAQASRRPSNADYDNPIDEPALWSGSFVLLDKFVTVDRDNKRIENSAEQPLDPVTTEDHKDTINVSFNTSTINLTDRNAFRGSINNAIFWGFAANVVKLVRWDYEGLYYGPSNTPYVSHSMSFELDTVDKWQLKLKDYGSVEIANGLETDPDKRYKAITDSSGRSIVVPLDGNGLPDTNNPPVAADLPPFNLLTEQNFATLPCPQTLPAWMVV